MPNVMSRRTLGIFVRSASLLKKYDKIIIIEAEIIIPYELKISIKVNIICYFVEEIKIRLSLEKASCMRIFESCEKAVFKYGVL